MVAARVAAARAVQRTMARPARRGVGAQRARAGSLLRSSAWRLPPTATAPLERRLERGSISLRGYDRSLRCAWTVADLSGLQRPGRDQVELALSSAARQASRHERRTVGPGCAVSTGEPGEKSIQELAEPAWCHRDARADPGGTAGSPASQSASGASTWTVMSRPPRRSGAHRRAGGRRVARAARRSRRAAMVPVAARARGPRGGDPSIRRHRGPRLCTAYGEQLAAELAAGGPQGLDGGVGGGLRHRRCSASRSARGRWADLGGTRRRRRSPIRPHTRDSSSASRRPGLSCPRSLPAPPDAHAVPPAQPAHRSHDQGDGRRRGGSAIRIAQHAADGA